MAIGSMKMSGEDTLSAKLEVYLECVPQVVERTAQVMFIDSSVTQKWKLTRVSAKLFNNQTGIPSSSALRDMLWLEEQHQDSERMLYSRGKKWQHI